MNVHDLRKVFLVRSHSSKEYTGAIIIASLIVHRTYDWKIWYSQRRYCNSLSLSLSLRLIHLSLLAHAHTTDSFGGLTTEWKAQGLGRGGIVCQREKEREREREMVGGLAWLAGSLDVGSRETRGFLGSGLESVERRRRKGTFKQLSSRSSRKLGNASFRTNICHLTPTHRVASRFQATRSPIPVATSVRFTPVPIPCFSSTFELAAPSTHKHTAC